MATVAEVIDSRAFSGFCGVESSNQVPDGDTLGRFRNILRFDFETGHDCGFHIYRGSFLYQEREEGTCPGGSHGKKSNTWHFGYKAHIGVDKESGLVHTVKVTAANEHDVTVTSELLTGDEEEVYGDGGYLGAEKRPEVLKKNKAGKSVHYKINRRPSQSKNNSVRSQAQIKRREHEKSSVRAKVEHVFAVVKLQLRFRKTRYRGLQKQIAKMNIMFALANLILADRPCLEA